MGDVKSQLDNLETNVDNADNTSFPSELLANSMTTLMVRGLFTNLEFPYAYFPSRKVTGYMLYDPLWEAVSRLEKNGFKVTYMYIHFMVIFINDYRSWDVLVMVLQLTEE